jgi:predicted homoserine dehydrogenase-like protein
MIILDRALAQREAERRPVRIALVGAGYMARGIAAHAQSTRGVEIVAIANRTIERATRLFAENRPDDVRMVATVAELEDAIARRFPVVTGDPMLLCRAEGVDVVMDATGEVDLGLRVALEAIAHEKHVVLVNAELDATLGPILKARADAAGVVITNTDGDEPGVTMNLFRYVSTIGLRPVLAGNIKGFIDPHRNPETQQAFAESVGQGAKMITSFADGTKLSMETTLVANATGFTVARRGMHGHRCAHVKDILTFYETEELLDGGFVDYVLGAEPGTGAFVVGYSEHPVHREYLGHFKMGDGPLYVFYTPWHLPQAEASLTAARAVIFRDASVAPIAGPRCDVATIAKRDLRAGEVLDGIGGFMSYGTIENLDVSRREGLLPMGLSEGCELVTDVGIDQPITYDDVRVPAGRLIDQLWREQIDRFPVAEPATR